MLTLLAATLAALDENTRPMMGFAWLIPAVSALLGAGKSLLGRKSKEKKEKVAAQETDKANRANFANSEKDRLARANSLQRNLSARGLDIQFDPETFTPREYAAPNNERVAGAGNTLGLLGDVAGGASALLSGYQQSKQRDAAFGVPGAGGGGTPTPMSPGQPTNGGQPLANEDTMDLGQLYDYGAQNGVSKEEMDQLMAELFADQATRPTQATGGK